MISTADPESMTVDERRLEVASILASGLLRHVRMAKMAESTPRETVSKEPRNRLELPAETRLSVAPRATENLDILLRTEVVIDAGRMESIRAALDRLNYTTVPGAEYMQFVKQLGGGRFVKIDLLTGPLGPFADDPRVKADDRRVRPRQSVKLHAHRTDEALGFQDNTMGITVGGLLSSGEPHEAGIYVLSAFTLLLMKLHAFRDRCRDEEKDLARHHALDIYRIVAMMTEQEFGQTCRQIAEHQNHPALAEAARIVAEYFDSPESLGSLRLRSHALWNEAMALREFLSTLQDLLVKPEA